MVEGTKRGGERQGGKGRNVCSMRKEDECTGISGNEWQMLSNRHVGPIVTIAWCYFQFIFICPNVYYLFIYLLLILSLGDVCIIFLTPYFRFFSISIISLYIILLPNSLFFAAR